MYVYGKQDFSSLVLSYRYRLRDLNAMQSIYYTNLFLLHFLDFLVPKYLFSFLDFWFQNIFSASVTAVRQ
jgi:hypothetical protein